MRTKRLNRSRLASWAFLAIFAIAQLVVATDVLARAGGGGSESYDSSDSFSSSDDWNDDSRDRSSRTSGPTRLPTMREFLLGAVMVVVVVIIAAIRSKTAVSQQTKIRATRDLRMTTLAAKGPGWDRTILEARAREVFLGFQQAWSEFDLKAMETLLAHDYYKRMVLELTVLSNLKRKNAMENVDIKRVEIFNFGDAEGEDKDWFEASISATAKDSIINLATGAVLLTDFRPFTENWTFVRENGAWRLGLIRQTTVSARHIEGQIAAFAEKNGFYYDPDFGWLMMPDKGAIFGRYGFGRADINNHVIGYYRGKVVEFYTYIPRKTDKEPANYVVAQAILPISYHDILVRKKTKGFWSGQQKPAGLNQMSLEYGDFNEKFEVFAHPEDRINSLELLTPNFMVKIYDLPFMLNIEIVGNVLYLYTPKRDVSYDQMLEVLSWAFDDMKM